MPCCGGHGGGIKLSAPLPPSRTGLGDVAGEALLNLSVLKTLSEHVDAATAVACYSVCRAWREAFGLSCLDSTMCTTEPVDSTRSRFVANLHGAVTLEVTQPAAKAQRGFERHIAALARNRHFLQLKVHLPVREAQEPQMALGALSTLQPLTQLTSLVISRNPAFTSAPHSLTEDDITALSHLPSLTFLELCTAVPTLLGLDKLVRLATASLTQLRTLAFGHTSALWRIPEVARLCQLLDVCPLLTDLRLRCCAPPQDAKQLPELMALPLPQRLTNFALTFARRLARGEGGAAAAAHAPAAGAADDDEEAQYGEYEDMEEPWDSVDHLAPKPGLHVLIVEKGSRVTRMDVNVTVSVSASALPTVSMAGARERPRGRGRARRPQTPYRRRPAAGSNSDDDDARPSDSGAGGADEEDVPPYDVTPMVLSEYNRLLQQELGLTGSLAEPEDLHLGVRLDILEDEDEALAAAAAVAMNNMHQQNPGGPAPGQVLQAAAHIHAALQAAQQQHYNNNQQQQPNQGQQHEMMPAVMPPHALQMIAALAHAAPPDGNLPPAFAALLNHMAQLNLGGGGAAGGGAPGPAGAVAAAAGGALQLQNPNNQNNQHGGGGGGGAGGGGGGGRGAAAPLAARAVQLQLGPLSPHMCYLNLALVPMVTQLAMVAPELGLNGEEVLQPPQPPADTRVAPVLLDLRGGGYTQLKSLAITGYVDQDCKPATWMSRGWLSRIPAGMPSLEYLALYDTLPAASNDPTAIEGLRALSNMEHLELRPLYLRFTGEVPCPMAVPPPALPPKLLQLTLKKVIIPGCPPPPPGEAPDSAAALALLPELSTLTHLWLFDCEAPDLMVFRRASRLEDLRLGGTTTTTRLSELLPSFPCLRGLILDCSHPVAPGWWSARQMSALLGLKCLRSLQIDAASLEPPPASSTASRAGGSSSRALAGTKATATSGSAAVQVSDSDDDSDAYLSTEEDSPVQLGGGAAGGASSAAPSLAQATEEANAGQQTGSGGGGTAGGEPGADGAAAGGGDEEAEADAAGTDLAAVLGVLSGLTQLTDLTLSFDTPTLFYDAEEEGEDDGADDGDADSGSDVSALSFAAGVGPGAGPSTSGAGGAAAKDQSGGGGDGSGSVAEGGRDHAGRVHDALLAGQAFVALAALQGLWRLRIGLPHGTVWEDVTERLMPGLRIAMPKTTVEMDVL
ncbi:hypothetical protein PLESTB_000815000 [Pleodorina starrii]|uniref:Uncharacterized protein n=1 Tax=Pleodorina starrii TaxID=330485 RepID=A0A9W6BL53_9CHLO|nr:hypothetical protein PLESTM_000130600 [Pleodorina starrii]GLC54018.1 hypothetical protein PLESTB_000815000 [Pleodorina starrii]GLC64676.1 hypothetical protein PLESTF_000191300 [Pleodorina starrii]